MVKRLQVTCINKTDRFNPYERISHIGGGGSILTSWRMTTDEAIDAIENGTHEFYVDRESIFVNVIVATHSGRKYLKTVAEGENPNNLLSLSECPS